MAEFSRKGNGSKGKAVDDAQVPKRRGRPPKSHYGNRETSFIGTGAEADNGAEGPKPMGWAELVSIIKPRESTSFQRRIIRVWCEDNEAPDAYLGRYGNAMVIKGPAAFQYEDGELVKL